MRNWLSALLTTQWPAFLGPGLPTHLPLDLIVGRGLSPGGMNAIHSCENYTTYSQKPHNPRSSGPLSLPYMRPPPECRTFQSPAVESIIKNVTSRLKDPDLARLFENTFPNTLDTTIKYFSEDENLAFVITGDIDAQWLRDTTNQLSHYGSAMGSDPKLAALIRAVINTEARYLSEYPYCGAFQAPRESGIPPSFNYWAVGVTVNPPVDDNIVFECKYELDSLSAFLKLSRVYFQATKDSSFMNANWETAVHQIFRVIEEQSQPTFDDAFNVVSFYNWTGGSTSASPPIPNGGNGEPKGATGLVGTSFRPSDDPVVFAYNIPSNAMMSSELRHLSGFLATLQLHPKIARYAKDWSKKLNDAVWEHGVTDDVFAYEVNGYGGKYFMDDANVPSLLSLSYMGFVDQGDSAFQATRKRLLSPRNPYFARGNTFYGVGGPHVSPTDPWPMSLVSAIYGTDDDEVILLHLYAILNNTASLGLIHESQSIHHAHKFTRSWFAWANSYFAEMVLDLIDRKPHLVLQDH